MSDKSRRFRTAHPVYQDDGAAMSMDWLVSPNGRTVVRFEGAVVVDQPTLKEAIEAALDWAVECCLSIGHGLPAAQRPVGAGEFLRLGKGEAFRLADVVAIVPVPPGNDGCLVRLRDRGECYSRMPAAEAVGRLVAAIVGDEAPPAAAVELPPPNRDVQEGSP
ncbi:MAG TPA: hypothetical protein VMW52_09245 [Phycisphaerae bacterium]|nr:hypothetical protein [Phycisphaerae bacterium]